VKRLALLLLLLAAAACARNGQPGFPPMPEARQGQIELDPQEATKKLAEAMTAAGLPVDEVATREGFVSTAWYDTTTKKKVSGRALGAGDVRIRAWVMPWRYGWSEITMEAVYRPLADPSLPERELERSVAYSHPARVAIREIMQQMGVTSTVAEADAPKVEAKPPTMDPGRVGKAGAKIGGQRDSAAADSAERDSVRADTTKPAPVIAAQDTVKPAPPADTTRPARRDSAIIFRPATPGDTVHRPARPAAPQPAPAPRDTQPVSAPTSGYAVQVAAPADAYTANEFARRLKGLGYESRIVQDGGRYKVRTQVYGQRPDAAIALERLRATFRDAFLVRE
jgi:cell division septation protein DedD